MIWVLTYYHHLYIVKRTKVEGIKNLVAWRETLIMQVFFPHQISKVNEILLIKLCTKVLFP